MHRAAPRNSRISSFISENTAFLGLDCNLCTMLYFGRVHDRLKAVFDAAESPLQAALHQE
jgi:hypothetical protein